MGENACWTQSRSSIGCAWWAALIRRGTDLSQLRSLRWGSLNSVVISDQLKRATRWRAPITRRKTSKLDSISSNISATSTTPSVSSSTPVVLRRWLHAQLMSGVDHAYEDYLMYVRRCGKSWTITVVLRRSVPQRTLLKSYVHALVSHSLLPCFPGIVTS
jgi:hypothetical protein